MATNTRFLCSFFVLIAVLFPAVPAEAKYVGGVRPICTSCNTKRPANAPFNAPSGTATSLSEGNLSETYPGPSLQGGSGGNLSLELNYDSYNADGSHDRVQTTLGVGWTHSYNVFLFSQRMAMFRYDGTGRVTKYTPSVGGAYVSTEGYFESLIRTATGFTLTYKDKTQYEFASVPSSPTLNGQSVYWLKKISHPRGTSTTLTYTGGLLTRIADTYGRFLTLSYNAGRKLSAITDPRGKVTAFQYDSTNTRLLRIIDPTGKAQNYTYNSLYQLTQKLDRDGRRFSFGYQVDKPLSTTDSAGAGLFGQANPNQWATDANALASQLMRVYLPSTTYRTDGRGNRWQYDYDEGGYIKAIRAPDNATTQYTYDPATLQLASVTDANHHTTQYQYDASGNLTTLTDALGHQTSYTYEPVFNQLTSVTDANGRVTSYDIDPANGNRLKETDPLGQTRLWTYDSHGNVLTETDKRGHVTSYLYDASGNRIQTIDRENHLWTASYDAVGNLLESTDPLGHKTCYQYDGLNRLTQQREACGSPVEKLTQYAYDGQGNRTQVVDANNRLTAYQYDYRQRLVKTTDALPPPQNFTLQSYDANDNRLSFTDRNGQQTAYQYDGQNRLIKTTDALGFFSTSGYDAKGNRLSETDANGHVTSYTYDSLDRMLTRTDAEGFVSRYGYDMTGTGVCLPCTGPTQGSNRVTQQTDGNGKVTYFTYDGLDRQVQQIRKQADTDFLIDSDDAVTAQSYDQNSNRLSLTEPNGNTTAYVYDNLDRQTRMTNAAGDVALTGYDPDGTVHSQTAPNGNVTTYTYDAQHRLIQINDSEGLVASYTYDPVGNRLTEKDGNNNGPAYAYDAIYRITGIADALGQTTHYDYDPVGNLLKITDRNGKITSHHYDFINRRIQTTDALGNSTQYEYDPVGNLKKLTDANLHATDYAYDGLNRLITETYADGGVRRFEYDAVNLIQRTDQIGQATNYRYNDLYFMLTRDYPGTGHDDTFGYDLSGRMLSACRGGAPDDLPLDSCAGWMVTFAYDGANRVTDTAQDGKTLHYAYDIPARTRDITYPGGRHLTDTTDARGRLSHIDDPSLVPSTVARYAYDLGNRVGTRDYRNGTSTAYSYNPNNWITALEHKKGAALLTGFAYQHFDNEGNKLSESKLPDGAGSEHKSEAYQYDDTYRLIDYKVGDLVGSTVPVPSTQTQYNLDPVGNWDQKVKDLTVTEDRLHDPANAIIAIDVNPPGKHQAPAYDANGNLVDDNAPDPTDGYRYAYDEENRLTSVTRKSDSRVVGSYQYDALSRRIIKQADPATPSVPIQTRYFYDNARIVEEQNELTNTLATYVYGNYIDEVLTMDRSGSTYYYHQNALWSVEAVSDNLGNVVERYAYDAYGQPSIYNGLGVAVPVNAWGTPHSPIGNPWMFTGRQFDEETGIYFYRARYYDPGKGRFLQRDPLGYVDGMNLYEYVSGNPVGWSDAFGLVTDAEFEALAGVDDAIKNGKMTADAAINGKEFSAKGCVGNKDCNIGFKFEKAYTGTYRYRAAGKDVKGVYVKISVSFDQAKCCKCDKVRYIQVLRNTVKQDGKLVAADPGSEIRRQRSGWADPKAPSRGWRLDQLVSSKDPFYPGHSANTGNATKPAELYDSPGQWAEDKNKGSDFHTCVICVNDKVKGKVLGCVHWGYYIDGAGKIAFEPNPPAASCDYPQEFRDSVERWSGINGNENPNLDFPNPSK